MLVALVSAKGSPGVTAAALAVTAAAPAPALMFEVDPGGGDLECWAPGTGEAGLGGVVTALRQDADPEGLRAYAVHAAPGVGVVTGPVAAGPSTASILDGGDRLGSALAALEGWVVADCGRWSPDQSTARRVAAAAVVAVVCRPTTGGVAHAAHVVSDLRGAARSVALVVVGERPYSGAEAAGAVGAPLAGVLPWDPSALRELLIAGSASKRWRRSGLAAAAVTVVGELQRVAMGVVAGA